MGLSPAARAIQAAGWPAQPYSTDALTTNGVLYSGPCLLRGWAICNKNASSEDYELYDGLDTGGTPVAFFHLTSGQNTAQYCGTAGIMCDIGLFLTFSGGPLKGAIWATPLDDHELAMIARELMLGRRAEGDGA